MVVFWEDFVYEVKLDIDFDKQDPCAVAVRLQKINSVLSRLAYYVGIYRTANGLHIRAELAEPISKEVDLALRGLLNDDWERLGLDYWRVGSGLRQFDILFTWRRKEYDRENPVGAEKPISLDDAIALAMTKCQEKVNNIKRRRARRGGGKRSRTSRP